MKLKPIVMYQGGKARFADAIVDRILADGPISGRYVESFVGMGAVYLKLRERGYAGPAILNDANPAVVAVWRCLHDADLGEALAVALETTANGWPKTNAAHKTLYNMPVPTDTVRLATRFIYLQEGSFGGIAAGVVDGRWRFIRGWGCRFDGDAKARAEGTGGSRHDLSRNAALVRACVAVLAPTDTIVLNGPAEHVPYSADDTVYMDPPYIDTDGYGTAGATDGYWAWAAGVARRVYVSEHAAPAPWTGVAVGDRKKTQRGNVGTRETREMLFCRP